MSELFKEVTSQSAATNQPGDKREDGASDVAAANSKEQQPAKKAKHGDPGVCCGGCS